MLKVCVIGPNLLDQSKGDFHVHAYGCADTAKAQYRFHKADVETGVEVSSEQEVVEYVYADMIDEDSPWTDFASDLYFFPCTDALPAKTPEVTE